jgi:hypothetical protein
MSLCFFFFFLGGGGGGGMECDVMKQWTSWIILVIIKDDNQLCM